MPTGIPIAPGKIITVTDGADSTLTWTFIVYSDGDLGNVAGRFEKKSHPALGVYYESEDMPGCIIRFLADGSYDLNKQGPNSTGSYTVA